MRGFAHHTREFGLFIEGCEPEMSGPNHVSSSERLLV